MPWNVNIKPEQFLPKASGSEALRLDRSVQSIQPLSPFDGPHPSKLRSGILDEPRRSSTIFDATKAYRGANRSPHADFVCRGFESGAATSQTHYFGSPVLLSESSATGLDLDKRRFDSPPNGVCSRPSRRGRSPRAGVRPGICRNRADQIICVTTPILPSQIVAAQLRDSVPDNTMANLTTGDQAGSEMRYCSQSSGMKCRR